jgi:hypothetical protein
MQCKHVAEFYASNPWTLNVGALPCGQSDDVRLSAAKSRRVFASAMHMICIHDEGGERQIPRKQQQKEDHKVHDKLNR